MLESWDAGKPSSLLAPWIPRLFLSFAIHYSLFTIRSLPLDLSNKHTQFCAEPVKIVLSNKALEMKGIFALDTQ